MFTMFRFDSQSVLLCLQKLLVNSDLHVKSSFNLNIINEWNFMLLLFSIPASGSDTPPSVC